MAKTTTLPPREFLITLILSIFVGYLGIDRMYLGKIWTGLLKLITAGGLGLWWLIDILLIAFGVMRDKWGRELAR